MSLLKSGNVFPQFALTEKHSLSGCALNSGILFLRQNGGAVVEWIASASGISALDVVDSALVSETP